MKIILFGATGMLGNYVYQYLKTRYAVFPVNRDTFDILKNQTYYLEMVIQKIIDKFKINDDLMIINCMGLIPQNVNNTVNRDRHDYFIINSIFPTKLALLARKYNAKMIHITTDCVFNGSAGNYDEDSPHDEMNDYGLSKSLGEPDNCCVIRTSIIGEEKMNKTSLLEWVRGNSGGEINGYTNHFWNGITCLQLAKIIHQMIVSDIYWTGVRHIFSPNSVSKYELVSMINDIYKLGIKIKPIICEKKIDKTITTKYDKIFNIPTLEKQLEDLLFFNLV
jgi:dTDP-4-dehydrorhamnose reductase